MQKTARADRPAGPAGDNAAPAANDDTASRAMPLRHVDPGDALEPTLLDRMREAMARCRRHARR